MVDELMDATNDAEFYLATVTGWSADGAKIKLDGQDTAMAKSYKTLCGAVATNARVVVMKHSGTYVVLGVLSGSNTYVTITVNQILTPASGITINYAWYGQWGKVAMLWLRFYVSSPVTTTTTFKICDMVEDKRPCFAAPVLFWSNGQGYLNPAGDLNVRGTATDTTSYYTVRAVYLLA